LVSRSNWARGLSKGYLVLFYSWSDCSPGPEDGNMWSFYSISPIVCGFMAWCLRTEAAVSLTPPFTGKLPLHSH
jgi:hypothetical protein